MKKRRAPKAPIKYDLHEIYWQPYMENGVRKFSSVPRWVSTPVRNQPYTIVRFQMRLLSQDKKYPAGTKFIPCKTGTSVLEMLRGLKP